MDGLSVLSGSGIAGLALVGFYILKLFVDSRQQAKKAQTTERSANVTDAATANAVLRDTIDSLQAENGRLTRRVDQLENELTAKDRRIDELEGRVRDLQTELQKVADEIGSLRHKE